MASLTLDLVKQHVRSDDFTADDDVLTHYMEAAQAKILLDTNHTDEELLELGDGETWPTLLVQAALLLIGHWYNQREAVAGATSVTVPHGYDAIIMRFRAFSAS